MSTDRTQDECPANDATTPTLEFVADTEEFRVSYNTNRLSSDADMSNFMNVTYKHELGC